MHACLDGPEPFTYAHLALPFWCPLGRCSDRITFLTTVRKVKLWARFSSVGASLAP
jgi:hypothetical protein